MWKRASVRVIAMRFTQFWQFDFETQLKAEINRLMSIIIDSLYSNRDVFLRELIANAADVLHSFTKFIEIPVMHRPLTKFDTKL